MKREDAKIEVEIISVRWDQLLIDCAAICDMCWRGLKVYRDGDVWFHRIGRDRQAEICEAEVLWRADDRAKLREDKARKP